MIDAISENNQDENTASSVDPDEIHHFSKISRDWWDKEGPFKALHRMNPVRMKFITEQICTYYKRDNASSAPLKDLNILDVGCGGGLVCEPLAHLGAQLTGLDADTKAINVAKDHAKGEKLDITYLNEDFEDISQQYDVVLALEIIEHVSDAPLFIKQCANALKPEGLLIVSTMNRTAKSFAFGVIAAEYILNWVPKNTHSWKKFVKPSEITRYSRAHNLYPTKINGLIYSPLNNEFNLSDDNFNVSYLISLSSKP